MDLEIAPATPDRLDDLATVMAGCADGRKCWCAYWYLPNRAYKAGWGTTNREPLERLVKDGAEPGLIAYDGELPVGWVNVGPRARLDRLARSKTFVALDDLPVWSVSCFIVAKSHRRQGLVTRLADAAARFAFARGAPAVEAYPVDAERSSSAYDFFLGTTNAFLRAGYREVARPTPRRAVMRRLPGDAPSRPPSSP